MTPTEKQWEDIAVGDRFGPLRYAVDRDAQDAFCRSTRATHEWYRTSSPFGGPIVPSTLPSGDDFPLIGVELDTGVHAKHHFKLLHPLRVGEEAETTGVVTDKYLKRGYKYLVFKYELRRVADNELLSENTITFAIPPTEEDQTDGR